MLAMTLASPWMNGTWPLVVTVGAVEMADVNATALTVGSKVYIDCTITAVDGYASDFNNVTVVTNRPNGPLVPPMTLKVHPKQLIKYA